MAGLLDSILGSYGGGGLLSGLMYPSPLLQPQEQPPQTVYSPDGMPIFTPQSDKPSPFGPPPGLDQWASQFAPTTGSPGFNPFSSGAAPAPFAPSFSAGPTIAPPQQPSPQPAPQSSLPPVDFPQNRIGVGGDYQMPRVGDASNFVPEQVNTPPNAQPAQGFSPPTASQPQVLPPALGGGGSALGRIFNPDGLIARLTGNDSRSIAQQNLKAQYDALVPLVGPGKALAAVLNPKAGESIFAEAFGNKDVPKSAEELMVRQAWDNRNKPGASLSDAIQKIQEYKSSEKAADAKAKTIAEKQGEIAANLPDTLSRTAEAIKQIDEVKNHPAKGYRTGVLGVAPAIPGLQGKGVDFDERVQQLRSANFLAAAQQMRSLGALSNAEGSKIEGVQARLKQSKDTADFDQALNDMDAILRRGYENLQKMAGAEKIKPYAGPSVSTSLPSGWSVSVR